MTNFFHADISQQTADREMRQRFQEVTKDMAASIVGPLIDGLTEAFDERSKEVKRQWEAMPARVRRLIV